MADDLNILLPDHGDLKGLVGWQVTETDKPERPGWGIAIGTAIAGALVGAFGTLATGMPTYWSHQADINTKMVELSIAVLRAKPTSESAPLRDWAINTIETRANFKFTDAQKQTLHKEALPSAALATAIGEAVGSSVRSLQPPLIEQQRLVRSAEIVKAKPAEAERGRLPHKLFRCIPRVTQRAHEAGIIRVVNLFREVA